MSNMFRVQPTDQDRRTTLPIFFWREELAELYVNTINQVMIGKPTWEITEIEAMNIDTFDETMTDILSARNNLSQLASFQTAITALRARIIDDEFSKDPQLIIKRRLVEYVKHWTTLDIGHAVLAWDVRDLWNAATRVPIEVKSLVEILSAHPANKRMAWEFDDLLDFAQHCKRCSKALLDYPIILTDDGRIIDGRHRIVQAIVVESTSLPTVTLKALPDELIKVYKDDTVNYEVSERLKTMKPLNE